MPLARQSLRPRRIKRRSSLLARCATRCCSAAAATPVRARGRRMHRQDCIFLRAHASPACHRLLPGAPAQLGRCPPCLQVFVAGATGQTGRRVVRELRKRGYTVIAGVRVRGLAVHRAAQGARDWRGHTHSRALDPHRTAAMLRRGMPRASTVRGPQRRGTSCVAPGSSLALLY